MPLTLPSRDNLPFSTLMKVDFNYFSCKGSVKEFFLYRCCLITASPIHKILQELGFPTTKLSLSTGKELVTNNLFHNCEIAFLSFLEHYFFAYSWNWSSAPLHKKNKQKTSLQFFFWTLEEKVGDFGEIYWFSFYLVWNVTFKFTPSNSCLHLSLHCTRN